MFTCRTLLLFAGGILSSNGHPIDPKVIPVGNGFELAVLGAAFLLTSVIALIACTCCKERRDGFKEFRNPPPNSHVGFTNVLSSEVAIFPPPGSSEQSSGGAPSPTASPVPADQPSRPATFSTVVPPISDWFVDPNANFPRQQLFYQKEIGKGWFGKVVKGEARGVKVVVRILREDATAEEKGYFLHEAKPFRDLRHKNISRLFARCLDHDPFLLLFEFCNNGDLKSFLVTNSASRNAITEQKISLKMMIDVTEGLKFMNDNGFIHTDLASRNCLVTSDLTVKIGDYGTSIDKYKNEYYIVGDMAVPIRWCAPETLTCTSTTIETKQVTLACNVWSLSVVLWEIAEFGRLPYSELSDEQVITRVFGDEALRLPQPICPFGQYLNNIMALCWKSENRTDIGQVLIMLNFLKNNPFHESDFEARWRMTKPNSVAVIDNHTPIHSPRHTELAQRPRLMAKLEFDSGVDLEIKPTDSCRTSTPNTISPQLSVTSEEIFQAAQEKSPSLTNLKGSLEDVGQFDSWLASVEQKTEEDKAFVKNISEAIKNLDETLALEKTSSSSQDSSLESTKKPLLDFKLGPFDPERKGDSSSSDTEEETWRNRIERGELTEKVKEKSKSVTDLMVLTHIDSEGSESDSLPSLTRQYSLKRKGVSYTGVGFGSEGNIHNAVLSQELQEKFKQLTLWKTDDQSFLVKRASETNFKNDLPHRIEKKSPPIKIREDSNVIVIPESDIVNINETIVTRTNVRKEETLKDVNSECEKVSKKCQQASVVENKVKTKEESCIVSPVDNSSIMQSDSSQLSDNQLPQIVITESEILEELTSLEPQSSIDTQYLVKIKPRKFVFVCRDMDEDSLDEEDESSQNSDANSDIVAVKPTAIPKAESRNDKLASQGDSVVIIGSSEEHTLDFFKGLKTTFTPDLNEVNLEKMHEIEAFDEAEEEIDVEREEEGKTLHYENNPIRKICFAFPEERKSTSALNENISDVANTNSTSDSKDFSLPDVIPEKMLVSLSPDVEKLSTQNTEISKEFEKNISFIPKISSKDNIDDLISAERSDFPDNKFILENNYFNLTENRKSDFTGASSDECKILNNTESGRESKDSSGNSSEEQLVEAPFPFNQKEAKENNILNIVNLKSKSLDSFLTNNLDRVRNGEINSLKTFVPVFNMTESVSENAFNAENMSYDPYISLDSGHSSDRCMEQQMNDLKSRLEDVAKSGSDFQLKNSEDEYGGKLLTPDDERSSDSGFRDKGSLSESVEDTCDEKYNLEDIDAELDEFTSKNIEKDEFRYYEQFVDSDREGWFLHRPETSAKESGWTSHSMENEEALTLSIDAKFAAAIRNELKEKLPGSQQTEKTEDESNSPEQELTSAQFTYPSQLSPILEEQESNHSSLQLYDLSPIFILPPPEIQTDTFEEDIVGAFESLESSRKEVVIEGHERNDIIIFDDDKMTFDDDVLVIDTETNEATLIESPKPQSHLAFILPKREDDFFVSEDSPEQNSENYILTPDNAPLTPISIGTESHSSPENGNMSGLFMSPCSVRSDLFDSGPPSLPFDLGQSLEEVEDLPIQKMSDDEAIVENPPQIVLEPYFDPVDFSENSPRNEKTEEIQENDIKLTQQLLKDADDSLSKNVCDKADDKSCENGTLVTNNSNGFKESNTKPILLGSPKIDAEAKIDHLIMTPKVEIGPEEKYEKISSNLSLENDWLKDLIFTNELSKTEEKPNNSKDMDSDGLLKKDWPTLDELIAGDTAVEKQERLNIFRPGITSTLALLSPDLSSADSKSHSLLSSFSSTPTTDESKTICDSSSVEVIRPVPKSLSLKPDGGAPMPSPEDAEKGWRPTICQLMELTDQAAAEGEEMTTSFIEPDENGICTPDWESDISEEHSSSSSGEFVWKEGDKEELVNMVSSDSNCCLLDELAPVMERIDEEDEDDSSSNSSGDTDSDSSSSAEFIPSTWNAMAVPLKSALRLTQSNSEKTTTEKKRVVFKKEKYQCVYEYPREESDDEEEENGGGSVWDTPTTPPFDYSMFTDWELADGEIPTPIDSIDSDSEDIKNVKAKKENEFDFYRLDYNLGSQLDRSWTDPLPEDEIMFSPLASDLNPVARLGDLKHTKATLRLELPTLRPDHGEASILDSGIDTA